MRRTLSSFFLLIVIFITINAQSIKVACVGNSITFGRGVKNPEKNSYPSQLNYYLGDKYEGRNFGVSARTLMNSGDRPYTETEQYKSSLDYNPDIVVIKLGTNDAKTTNRDKLSNDYKKDYQNLINSYKSLPSKPRIILANPVPCYRTEGDFAGANQIYEKTIISIIEELAFENNIEIIDLYHLFDKNAWKEEVFPDKLHPSSLGATTLAERIGGNIADTNSHYKIQIDAPDKVFNFHGYKGYKMGNDMIVEPKRCAKDNPWVIRARFWGHQPQTDIALLEKGFHIAYCDVADLYGSPTAIKRYDQFYKQMTALGLNKKVVLEGMSRGGLIVFNWAAKNTDKVAAIYADAPVLDFKSWPLGLGKSNSSEGDTNNLFKAYGFKNIEQAKTWTKNPIDQIKKLSKIPIMLVVGDADEVVPVAENSAIFEREIKGIKVIHKPGIGHHPHSLDNPIEIVKFILKNTGQYNNICTMSIPGSEYRGAAGWKDGSDWHEVSEDITAALQGRKIDLLLIGNSITQTFGSANRKKITTFAGKKAMDSICSSWESAGISGDRTQNVLWRLKNGNYEKSEPKNVIITIGVNNIGAGDSGEETAEGIIAVLKEASQRFPSAQIYTFGLFPVSKNPTDPKRIEHDKTHAILAKTKMPTNVKYINLKSYFCNENETLRSELYNNDNLHLTENGYKMLSKVISTLLK